MAVDAFAITSCIMSSADTTDFSDSNPPTIESMIGSKIRFGDPSIPYFTADQDMESITSHTTGRERHKFLFLNPCLSDVTLVVDGHNIPVHSLLLSAASEAFAKMFSSDWKKEPVMQVPDCRISAFMSLLRFVYTDEIVMQKQDIGPVLRLADRLLVQSLIDAVTAPALDAAVVLPAAEFAIDHNNRSDLMFRCFSLIDSNPVKFMSRPEFLTVSASVIREMATRDSCAVREIRLFDHCIRWSVAECERRGIQVTGQNERLVMQPFLHLIRFPLMTGQEFTGSPVRSGVLTDSEKCLVLQFLLTRDTSHTDLPFSRVPRTDRSLVSRADRTKICPNIVSKDRKRGVGMHDVVRRSKKRLHLYVCESCDLSVCAVCAEDCHVSVQHTVRYRGRLDSWCTCMIHNCSKIRYDEFCILPDVQSIAGPAHQPTSGSSDDSD